MELAREGTGPHQTVVDVDGPSASLTRLQGESTVGPPDASWGPRFPRTQVRRVESVALTGEPLFRPSLPVFLGRRFVLPIQLALHLV